MCNKDVLTFLYKCLYLLYLVLSFTPHYIIMVKCPLDYQLEVSILLQ